MKATRKRSILKTITFRVLATLSTLVLVYIFTGQIILSISIALVETVVKTILYYLHERIWSKTTWGHKRHPLDGMPVTRELTNEQKKELIDTLKSLGYID